ncbi:MAG: MCE family protein [Verrucomicrobia bacterium]|nr:MCE family protein [Verrucomicrobiota bacterium]
MSKKANPTSIGIFIVVGLALGVTGLLLFGSSRWFTQTKQYILYFDSSLNGLNEGAPVKYRGVTVGSVERVMIRFNQANEDTAMPVIIELREDLIQERWHGGRALHELNDLAEEIKRGLRASLQSESLVTGVLYVSLETLRDPPPPVYHQLVPTYPEIPTRPTEIQQLLRNLAQLDVAGMIDRLNSLIGRIDTAMSGLKLGEISDGVTNLVNSLNRVVSSPELTNSLARLETTLEQYQRLAEKVHDRVDPLADSVTNTLTQASSALAQIQAGVQNLRDLLAPDSAMRHDLTLALEQLADAAHSVSTLAEFLRTHPNALITGRRATPNQP